LCRQAIERNPKSADAWNWLTICLAASGRRAEAIEAAARGIEHEPHHVNIRTSQAWAYLYTGDYEVAEDLLAKAVQIDPNAGYAQWTYGLTLRYRGKMRESIALFERLVDASNGRVALYLSLYAGALAEGGERSKAEATLADLESRKREGDFVPSIDFATILTPLGDHEGAIDALERAREERNALTWGRIHMPDFIALRSSPRWRALAQRFGRTAPFAERAF